MIQLHNARQLIVNKPLTIRHRLKTPNGQAKTPCKNRTLIRIRILILNINFNF